MRIFLLLVLTSAWAHGQLVTPSARWTSQRWDARWITPKEEGTHFGVYHFRKKFNLTKQPSKFVIHISADNRYRLYINGTYINEGPQISDLRHWRFESLDIASYLKPGDNVLAIQLTYYGEAAPVYLMGRQAGLIVQGDDKPESIVNTDNSWKYVRNESTSPIVFYPGQAEVSHQYYAAGPMERINGENYPWGWEQLAFEDGSWKAPGVNQTGAPFGVTGFGDERWELLPRSIPLMERSYEPITILRKSNENVISSPMVFQLPMVIPAGQKTVLLFDNSQLTTAFPEFTMSKGKGRSMKVTYAEALFNDIDKKGHRDSIEGKKMNGVYDIFIMDGGDQRKFTTTAYRAFRYVQVEVDAGNQPLIIDKIGGWFTGYPFQKKASFSCSDESLSKVFDLGWRTARLCAYETYMDCPYWERLQYVGDTRIQALVSYYVSGDDRLARNALSQFEWSLTYDGLTYSRYPSSLQQFIPNYSLVWVLMVNDYFMYGNDPEFVRSMLPGVKRVLDHFQRYVTADSMLTEQPYWDFIDHTFNTHKVFTESYYKRLTTNTLFYALTLNRAADLFSYFKMKEEAIGYSTLAYRLKSGVRKQCWDGNSQLFADSPDKKHFSMHSNILAVLCGLMPKDQQVDLLKRIVSNKGITPTTLYFDFYLARAMSQVGGGDLYFDLLDNWRDLLKQGLTTMPEGLISRSDCHAWSASPNFEMLATFAGIQPLVPGFKKVAIKPRLQKIDQVKASMPHWAGMIDVEFVKTGDRLTGLVKLPEGISGKLEWGSKTIDLKAGINSIDVSGQR